MNFDKAPGTKPHNPQKVQFNHAEVIKERLQDLMMHMPAAGYIRQAGLIPHAYSA
jgi:hypothetical protein